VAPSSRRPSRGEKWTLYPEDVLPLWVADMDFEVADPIRRMLRFAVERSDVGYPIHPAPTDIGEITAARMRERFGWTIDPARVEVLCDVVQGLAVSLLQYAAPGEGAVVQTPIYPPFLEAVRTTGRWLIENRLLAPTGSGRRWEVDLDDFRAAAKRARIFLLCNPHNPTGRVFTRAELLAMAEIAVEHDLVVLADEIHQDLLFPGHEHVPFASLGDEVARRTVTYTSATKTWNIAGLCCAVAHFGPDSLLATIDGFPPHYLGRVSIAGIEATAAAWREGDPWLAELMSYLDANRQRLASFVRERLDGIDHVPPEATFLAWLDCRALDLAGGPHAFFLERARVALSDGPDFGEAGRGFVRLNFATPRALLDAVLDRMARALESFATARAHC
jgi:cysteine-S-conjugate beta-lyase